MFCCFVKEITRTNFTRYNSKCGQALVASFGTDSLDYTKNVCKLYGYCLWGLPVKTFAI